MAALVYINGFPGVGKLTVATELKNMLPKATLIDNHQLIDPVARKFEREHPEYQSARKAMRATKLVPIATSTCPSEDIWIFTDSQSSDELGRTTAEEFQEAATRGGIPFISIVLSCELGENRRRLLSPERLEGKTTKLTDMAIFEKLIEGEVINRFETETELVLEITSLTSKEAAIVILKHLNSVLNH